MRKQEKPSLFSAGKAADRKSFFCNKCRTKNSSGNKSEAAGRKREAGASPASLKISFQWN